MVSGAAADGKKADELADILKRLDLNQHAKKLQEEGIDLAAARKLTDDHFQELGLNYSERSSLISALAESCVASVSHISQPVIYSATPLPAAAPNACALSHPLPTSPVASHVGGHDEATERRAFRPDEVQHAWEKCDSIAGRNPDIWRRDAVGNVIHRQAYGERQNEFGWEVDHSRPLQLQGTYHPNNLHALQWKQNASKGDEYPYHYPPSWCDASTAATPSAIRERRFL